MKINELRIGNLVMYSNDGSIFTVNGLHEYGMDCFDENEETYIEYDQFQGIPLTEEWLLKFGIKRDSSNYYFLGGGMFELYFVDGVLSFEIEGKVCTSAKSVHELQNVWFSLYKEELTTKEK